MLERTWRTVGGEWRREEYQPDPHRVEQSRCHWNTRMLLVPAKNQHFAGTAYDRRTDACNDLQQSLPYRSSAIRFIPLSCHLSASFRLMQRI